MLQDRELLVPRQPVAGRWPGTIVELPESLHGIIAARLDTLSADEKALIHDAAVVGRTAWVGAVCALTERSAGGADRAAARPGTKTAAAAGAALARSRARSSSSSAMR